MPRDTPLQRELAVLEEIIQYYLEHHEAISARTLAKISRLALSPTTIRNLMEDLSAEGFLTSEGVPRGRVPTQKAFGIYVTRLNPGTSAPAQSDAFQPQQSLPLNAALSRIGSDLARLTGCVVLAAFPAAEEYLLDWVHFGTVPGNRVLVAVQTLLGDLWTRILDTARPFPDDLLRELVRFIDERYRGAPLLRVRQDIMSGEPKELLDRMPSLGAAFRMLRRAFEWDPPPQRIWGQEHLIPMQMGLDARRLFLLQQALADPHLLRQGLGLGRGVAGARVALGTETGYEGLVECAMIGHAFGSGGWEGTLGVLGPMGMNYPRVLDGLMGASAVLSQEVAARHHAAAPAA